MAQKEHSHFVKLGIIILVFTLACGLFYYAGKTVQAQETQTIPTMRCTPILLSGMQRYDVSIKKIAPERRQVVINRCEGEDVICFHSFDQSGFMSCIKK